MLQGVLRKELGFGGYIFSDYGGVDMMRRFHRIAQDAAEAAAMAVRAGVDVEAPNDICYRFLAQLVRDGKVPLALIDASVRRILVAKFRMGLFERPYVDLDGFLQVVRASEHIATGRQVAEESVTLFARAPRR